MKLPWGRQAKRDKLRLAPFPERWLEYLQARVPYYAYLTAAEQEMLRGDLRIFMAEKYWEGCGGLALTEEIKVVISAQACLLTLGLPQKFYPNVRSILVYPAGFRVPEREVVAPGIVTEGTVATLGQAWQHGPVVLSWQDAKEGAIDPSDGQNLVFHEFARQLDMVDGVVDGVPRLYEDEDYRRWFEVMSAEYEALSQHAAEGRAVVLGHYGAQDAAELFAVCTEAFFEKPREMRQDHPLLYRVLQEYYQQDPAARLDRLDDGGSDG